MRIIHFTSVKVTWKLLDNSSFRLASIDTVARSTFVTAMEVGSGSGRVSGLTFHKEIGLNRGHTSTRTTTIVKALDYYREGARTTAIVKAQSWRRYNREGTSTRTTTIVKDRASLWGLGFGSGSGLLYQARVGFGLNQLGPIPSPVCKRVNL